MKNLTPALQAIALQFARTCYSEIETDEGYGRKAMPAQIYPQVEVFVDTGFWTTPDLEKFTIVQLGMLADLQIEADQQYWDELQAHQINAEMDAEQLILDTIAMGAGDRKTALRWLDDMAA